MTRNCRWLAAAWLILQYTGSGAADTHVSVYDPNPEHLWNRLYRQMAVRSEGGTFFGVDSSTPTEVEIDDPRKLLAVIQEFRRQPPATQGSSELKRALLLHDAWAAFDLAAGGERTDVQVGLAAVIDQLKMADSAIARLPDNYRAAVTSSQFAPAFDPARPDAGFLPPDLFDENGPWVEIGADRLIAPFHVGALSGRSAFRIFIRCPGDRASTLAYLERLNLYKTPWSFEASEIGIASPDDHPVREPPKMNRATPQFPVGTMVALVRRMAVINDQREPVMTPITQSVQLRVFKKVSTNAYSTWPDAFADAQLVFEFVMRRRDLLAGASGGLHQVVPEETGFLMNLMGDRAVRLNGSRILSTCARCHSGNGVFSLNSYTQVLDGETNNPQVLPVDDPGYQAGLTMAWKKRQFDWGLLRGLLQH
jgi:hypothetical protein